MLLTWTKAWRVNICGTQVIWILWFGWGFGENPGRHRALDMLCLGPHPGTVIWATVLRGHQQEEPSLFWGIPSNPKPWPLQSWGLKGWRSSCFCLELPLSLFKAEAPDSIFFPEGVTRKQVWETFLIQLFLPLQAPWHQCGHKNTNTSYQQSEVYLWGQVVMAAGGWSGAGPPSCTTGGSGPAYRHWLYCLDTQSTPCTLKPVLRCPLSRAGANLYLVDPTQGARHSSVPHCKLWYHLAAIEAPLVPSWVFCALTHRPTSAGVWGQVLCSVPLSATVCCRGSRFRGNWNRVFVNLCDVLRRKVLFGPNGVLECFFIVVILFCDSEGDCSLVCGVT